MLATVDVDRLRMLARFNTSGLMCIAFVVVIGGLTLAGHDLTVAVYSLSFWHYYLYGLAYRFGSIPLETFKRDAILMKTISIGLGGWIYLLAPINLVSLVIVSAGFLLNALGARALGSDRTYYGYELARLPPRKVTQFPYSRTAHPMLLGNIAAFGATMLNADFRWRWWPLAVAHVAMNLGLLMMEVFVRPKRLDPRRSAEWPECTVSFCARKQDIVWVIVSAVVGTGFGGWAASRDGTLLGSSLGAAVCLYVFGMYCWYTAARTE
jgi:hypothetical protein